MIDIRLHFRQSVNKRQRLAALPRAGDFGIDNTCNWATPNACTELDKNIRLPRGAPCKCDIRLSVAYGRVLGKSIDQEHGNARMRQNCVPVVTRLDLGKKMVDNKNVESRKVVLESPMFFLLQNITHAPVSPSRVAIPAARSKTRVNRTTGGLWFLGSNSYE